MRAINLSHQEYEFQVFYIKTKLRFGILVYTLGIGAKKVLLRLLLDNVFRLTSAEYDKIADALIEDGKCTEASDFFDELGNRSLVKTKKVVQP